MIYGTKKEIQKFIEVAREVTGNEPELYDVQQNSWHQGEKMYAIRIKGMTEYEFQGVLLERGLI